MATATKKKPASKKSAKKSASARKAARTAAPVKASARTSYPASKRVYFFGNGKAEGRADMKKLLGGKGANLADMTIVPLPVPPGFTITTETCREYNDLKQKMPKGLLDEVKDHLARCEKATGKKFGSPTNPLLLAVRSGAFVSMPGMMDTVLNIGLNDAVVEGLAKLSGNERFAYDSYRRLINMFGDTVKGIDHHFFEHELSEVKKGKGVELDTDLDVEGLKEVVQRYKKIYKEKLGEEFPSDGLTQLAAAIEAVFQSWMGERAIRYRQINDIRGLAGTAVNVQSMVFGNMGETSATGVAFTRDPSTGENEFYGEFLVNAQGEDVVAGIRTPLPCKTEMPKWSKKAWQELLNIKKTLENRYRDVQDIEFTIERGTFYILQTRNGKRTAAAAVRIAVEMVKEKLIDEETAVLRVDPASLDQLLHPQFDPKAEKTVLAKGLPASPGAAVGKLAFTAEDAEQRVAAGKKILEAARLKLAAGESISAQEQELVDNNGERILLVRRETEPADIGGMHVSKGIMTSTGGMTSHAAVVARGMGTPCVAGAGDLQIDAKAQTLTVNGKTYGPDDVLSLNGGTGEVYEGAIPTVAAGLTGPFGVIMKLADRYRTLKVRTNADTPKDAAKAREYGAEGIGLTRTEHMFFDPQRIHHMREMILATDVESRKAALAKLLPYQREDFVGIFKEMKGLPVTIRLLDPPLHEFLPHNEKDQQELANSLGKTLAEVKGRVDQLHESNPMLGHRGDRLAVTYPEILEMQVRAIIEAAVETKKAGIKVLPEIMIPLAGTAKELEYLKKYTVDTANAVFKEKGTKVDYLYGTMIEVPRAALTADDLAKTAEFFSFGTNDLTQMTFGYSRDDAGVFLPEYLNKEILERDPFQGLDQGGVGKLVDMAVKLGRGQRPGMKMGICGEHGGDPQSVEFCHNVGLDYVSCSPFRVPIARLAAAQAAIKSKGTSKGYSLK